MALHTFETPDASLSGEEIAAWRKIPTAVASDELNRTSTADAGIRSITRAGPLVGIALPVRVAAGDNLALHHAVSRPGRGKVLVVDAGGYDRTAVWGGILHRAAERAGYAGVVIDGCVRDSAEIAASALICYARGIVPAGPHKGWGGEINSTVQIGGAVVTPGDVVLGDDDGIAIVPYADRTAVLERAQKRLAAELDILRRLDAGETTLSILGLKA